MTRGRVIQKLNHLYRVALEGCNPRGAVSELLCNTRGLLKKHHGAGDIWVGDWVTLDAIDAINQTACIVSREERHSQIERPAMANLDVAMIVYPWPLLLQDSQHEVVLNRFMVQAALAGLAPVVILSKFDLVAPADTLPYQPWLALWQDVLNYPVHADISIYAADSIERLRLNILHHWPETEGTVMMVMGPSGAGKSSLLNVLSPRLNLKTQTISEKLGHGRQTTRHVQLLPFLGETFIADSPGFWPTHCQVSPKTLLTAFPEFADIHSSHGLCQFSACLHTPQTSGCVIYQQQPLRYAQYLTLLAEAMAFEKAQKNLSQKESLGSKMISKKGKLDGQQVLKLKPRHRQQGRNTRRHNLLDEQDD